MVASSTRKLTRSNPKVSGTFLFFMSLVKQSLANKVLNSALNAPQQEINAHEREEFPTNLLFQSPISKAPLFHLSFSPARDQISCLAVLIFFLVLSAFYSKIFLASIYLENFSLSSASNFWISVNSSQALASSFSATWSLPSQIYKKIFLGLTILDFSLYSLIAKAHLRIPAAATDAFLPTSSLNHSSERMIQGSSNSTVSSLIASFSNPTRFYINLPSFKTALPPPTSS